MIDDFGAWLDGLPVARILLWLTVANVVSIVLGIVFLPRIVARLPSDYFLPARGAHPQPTWGELVARVLRNALGIVLVLAGIVLLVLPGQGLLTILLGLVITDVPGRRRAERWIFRRRGVEKSLNWLRRRAGVAPFTHPDDVP